MNIQDNMPSLEASNPIAIGPGIYNLPKVQDKEFKTTFNNMPKDLKDDMNKCLN